MENKIFNKISSSNSILLLTHEDPDGDAIGSLLGFYHYLVSINKSVDMVATKIPKILEFLPSVNKIVDSVDKNYDLAIILDCASMDRIGCDQEILSKCKETICIDHHASNNKYCDVNLVCSNVSSCCQVIYYLFKKSNITFNNDILNCLISGVLTDTNGFSINTVDHETYIMAADMCRSGINIHELFNKLLFKKSLSRHNLMKLGLDRLELLQGGKIAITYILNDDFVKLGAVTGEHEGIVDIGRSIDGVLVSIFLRENEEGFTVSLRSTGIVDVSKIASRIGGGGHFMAAGTKLFGTLEETKQFIIDEVKKEL